MSKRINIVLPDKTLAVLDRLAPIGHRSQFISRAVLHFIQVQGKQTLRERLKREAIANGPRDLEMAAEWFSVEEEAAAIAPRAPARMPSKARKARIA